MPPCEQEGPLSSIEAAKKAAFFVFCSSLCNSRWVLTAVVIALIFGFLLARRLSQPLKELTLAAGRIADGELEQEVPVRSKDEVGKLTESFNRMSNPMSPAPSKVV